MSGFKDFLIEYKKEHDERIKKVFSTGTETLFESEKCRISGYDLENIFNLNFPHTLSGGGVNIWNILPFYNQVVVILYPISRPEDSYRTHGFKANEVEDLVMLNKKNRLLFTLASPPEQYSDSDFLYPIFEECQPLYIERTQKWEFKFSYGEDPNTWKVMVEKLCSTRKARNAFKKFAERSYGTETDETIANHVISTYIRLKALGYDKLGGRIIDFLVKDPIYAPFLAFSCRGMILEPISNEFRGTIAIHKQNMLKRLAWTRNRMYDKRLTFPNEIGQFLFSKFRIPAPVNVESFYWIEDNFDMASLRRAYGSLFELISDCKIGVAEKIKNIEESLDQVWKECFKQINAKKKLYFWTIVLSSAAIGAIPGAPIGVGLLTGLGCSVASTLIADPISEYFAKKRIRKPFLDLYEARKELIRE